MASASWQIAVELFEVCQRKMLQSDPFLCSAVINAYQRARRWHLAISGLELESINQVAYGAAISACQQADEWKVAERLFQDMLQLQMESNAQILSALMAGGAWKSSVNALSNVQVDPVLASAAISACNGGDRWLPGLAQLIFFRQHLVELNVYSYNSAMNGEGPPRWMAASSIFQRIEGELLQMNVVSYNSLISCYSQVSHWMLSLATALELRCSGLRLSEVSTAVSCSGCEKGRHWQMAFTLLSAWRSRFSIGSVVSACEKCSQWAEALSLLCGAQRSSHGGATAVNAAVSACEKSCRWRHALQLMGLPEMRCDIITWTAVATACAAAAWRVTLQMLVRQAHLKECCGYLGLKLWGFNGDLVIGVTRNVRALRNLAGSLKSAGDSQAARSPAPASQVAAPKRSSSAVRPALPIPPPPPVPAKVEEPEEESEEETEEDDEVVTGASAKKDPSRKPAEPPTPPRREATHERERSRDRTRQRHSSGHEGKHRKRSHRGEGQRSDRGRRGGSNGPVGWHRILSRGSVVEAFISDTPITNEKGLWAGFLVLDTGIHTDGSLKLDVKSLGCSHPETTKELSSMFNRKPGILHLCAEEMCFEDFDNALHIKRLRVYGRGSYYRSFMTHHTRNQMRIWLTNAGILDGEEEEEEPPAGADSHGAGSRESGKLAAAPKKEPKERSKKAKAPGAGETSGPPVNPDTEARRLELRKRLESARRKMVGEPEPPATPGTLRRVGDGALPPRQEEILGVESSDTDYTPSVGEDPKELESGTHLPPLGAGDRPRSPPAKLKPGHGKRKKPGSRNEGVKSKKKKDYRAGTERRALEDSSGATMTGLQGQLMKRAAERTRHQAELKDSSSHRKSARTASKELLRILTNAGKDRKKEKKEKKRRQRKAKIKLEEGGDPSDSSGSSSSKSGKRRRTRSSGSSSSSTSEDQKLEAPLRRRSKKRPGSVLEMLVEHARMQLDQTSKLDIPTEAEKDLTSGIKLTSYFSIVVKPQMSGAVGQIREMFHLASAMDLLRRGELSLLGDLLAGRFISLHQAHLDGSWTAAKHLEVLPMEEGSAASSSIVLAARKHAKTAARALGYEPNGAWKGQGKGSGGKGKSAAWTAPDWGGSHNKGKQKGQKGKGKNKNWWGAHSGDGGPDNKKQEKPGDK
eukprot:s3447_g3.t1